jgi:hypothetical protein
MRSLILAARSSACPLWGRPVLNNSKFILDHQWCDTIRIQFISHILFTGRIQFISHILFTGRIRFTDHILTDIIMDTTMDTTMDIITDTITTTKAELIVLRPVWCSRSTELHVLDLDSCRRNESHFCV